MMTHESGMRPGQAGSMSLPDVEELVCNDALAGHWNRDVEVRSGCVPLQPRELQ